MPKESTRLSSVAPIQDPAMKLNKEPEQTVDSKAAILQRLDQKLPAFGFLLAVFSCFFCVTTTLMVKLTPNLNTTVMLTIRCFFQTILYLVPILYQGQAFLSDRELNFMLIFRGCVSYVCLVYRYAALRLIPFGDATSINQSTPIYTSIIAYFWLGESFGFLQAFCVGLSFSGVILIAKPQIVWQLISGTSAEDFVLHAQTVKGTLYALLSAVTMSICFVIVRKLQKVPVMVVLFWFSLGSFACGCVHLAYLRLFLDDLTVRWPENTHEWVCTITSSLVGVTGQLMMNCALKVEEAGPISLARSGEILLSFLLQALILHKEAFDFTSLFGAFIIFTAIVLIALKRWAQNGSNPPSLLIWLFRPNRKNKEIDLSCSIQVVQVVQPELMPKQTPG